MTLNETLKDCETTSPPIWPVAPVTFTVAAWTSVLTSARTEKDSLSDMQRQPTSGAQGEVRWASSK